MAWWSQATKRPISPGVSDPRIQPIGVVLHVAVSNAYSLFGYFSGGSGGVESHFYVRTDGSCEQYRDTDWEADAQAEGNSWPATPIRKGFISVETEGWATGEWTPEQMVTIKSLCTWAHNQHGFPLQPCEQWNQPGVGYHSQFPQWNPNGHTCPGKDRIAQYRQVIVPWMAQTGDDDVSAEEVWTMKPWSSDDPVSAASALQRTEQNVRKLQADVDAVQAQLTLLQAAVAKIGQPPTVNPPSAIAIAAEIIRQLKP